MACLSPHAHFAPEQLDLNEVPVARRADLVFATTGDAGECVVKDPSTASYYRFGSHESFLLQQLDGTRSIGAICQSFQRRFNSELTPAVLQEFIQQVQSLALLRKPHPQNVVLASRDTRNTKHQSLLYWRFPLLDPDTFLDWLAPKLGLLFTPEFAGVLAVAGTFASFLLWFNRYELATQYAAGMRPGTLLLIWLIAGALTLCHEFSHGLACKRFGGQVHEMGFLLLYLTPCFYCNVSDSWLFKERSKRVCVTLAGPCCDLLMWSLAAIVWRSTIQDGLLNYSALITLSVLGIRILFNLVPLIKLDGYYALSDWMEIPNLQQRGWERLHSFFRWIVWNESRPLPESHSKFLFCFGAVSWSYSVLLLSVMLFFFAQAAAARLGLFGCIAILFPGSFLLYGPLRGLLPRGDTNMSRITARATLWLGGLGCIGVSLFFFNMDDAITGPAQIRAASHAELRAGTAGFLRDVCVNEGDCVSPETKVGRLEVPGLASRIAQKCAEIEESGARLRLLMAGPRPEEVQEQNRRIERADEWLRLAKEDLQRRRNALEAELAEFDQRIRQCQLQAESAADNYKHVAELLAKGAISQREYNENQTKMLVSQALLEQVRAQRDGRKALGTLEQENEIAKRLQALEEERSRLAVLTARARPDEIEALRKSIARQQEELRYLQESQQSLLVVAPLRGVISTPRLKQCIGQYYKEGELICEVEDPNSLEVEVAVPEQDAARIEPGLEVNILPRALPLQQFPATVVRVAPRITGGQVQGSLTVLCRLTCSNASLRSGMTGIARVYTGRRTIGDVLMQRVLRCFRSEFWW